MKLATGTIASLVLTIGALMLLIAGGVSENTMGRRPSKVSNLRRKLYNYSNSDRSYSGATYTATDDAVTDDYNSGSGSYGGSYSSTTNSYYNGQANGNSYNGRDQQGGGQSIQWSYDDDSYEPVVTYETYGEDEKFTMFGKIGNFSVMETFAIVGLVILLSMSVCAVLALKHGFNVVHLFQVYCFRGAFGHTDINTSGTDPDGETEDGFVKLDDEA
mmetsp:Transcript_21806/g.44810  ORF Transcript_21806/g.44810 Transcript_21806/m.44810 type:complete len:216 (-) Transcript_21806:179-826(-)|eukprot:CAMPEP_0197270288 /NCGR_PEP_ID=MMETSP1432-20130617/6926_1 /TAXON_ID=44447 /ORGANISM="Pseudo-nitzschia delicatissima, Strain UNC1205" /LENGTH=215 /DNA_ID=CAMNT_0042735569 /DNA_START=67 /DNA_END=714 /DNA_ORIENTATION=+